MLGNQMRSAFTEKNLIVDGTSLLENAWIKLGEYQVDAGERITVGYGKGMQDNAEGRIVLNLKDGSDANIPGTLRIAYESAQDLPIEVLDEFASVDLLGGTSPSDKVVLNEKHSGITEDKKLVLYYKAEADATVSLANTSLNMAITRDLIG